MLDELLNLAPWPTRGSQQNVATADFICRPMKFPGVLTAAECASIAGLGERGPAVTAGLVRPVEGYRRGVTKLVPLTPESKWLYERMRTLLVQVNQWYRYEITTMVESLLYCEYAENGQFDWHVDCGERRGEGPEVRGGEPARGGSRRDHDAFARERQPGDGAGESTRQGHRPELSPKQHD